MNQEETKITQIQAYLTGALPPNELAAVKRQIESDAEFAKEVEDYRILIHGIRKMGAESFEDKVASWEVAYKSSQDNEPQKTVGGMGKVRTFRWQYAAVSIAAGIAILFLIFNPFGPPPPTPTDQLFASHFEIYPDTKSVRGTVERSEDEPPTDEEILFDGMSMYNDSLYAEAAQTLAYYAERHPEDTGLNIYLGISELNSDKEQKAIKRFTELQDYPDYAEQGSWYLLLSYLKIGDWEKAEEIASKIVTAGDSYRVTDAKEILKSLKARKN